MPHQHTLMLQKSINSTPDTVSWLLLAVLCVWCVIQMKVKPINLKKLCIYCAPTILCILLMSPRSHPFSLCICSVPPHPPNPLYLTSAVGFRDLSRLTRGGFAAGSSVSLMRETEPFTAYTFSRCVCVCAGARLCS